MSGKLPPSTLDGTRSTVNAEVAAWEPAAPLGDEHAQALDTAAHDLGTADASRLRQVVQADSNELARLFDSCQSARLIGWLKALVLAEESIAGCDAGAKSPVIHLARLLRDRGDYPADLTAWIKSVSNNRFLPYGSLADRLRR